MTDLKKLRELAEAATPGPWEVSGTGQQVLKEADVTYGNQRICETNSMASHYPGKTSCWKNIAFIAAANPETVIALIDRIEKLEEALRVYDAGPNCSQSNVAREALKEET